MENNWYNDNQKQGEESIKDKSLFEKHIQFNEQQQEC
jgi:hypothetical protein